MYAKQGSILKVILVFVGFIIPLIGIFFTLGPFFGLEPNYVPFYCLLLTMNSPLLYLWLQKRTHESEDDDIQEV